jgi:thymidylate synthase (FAD)
MENTNRLVCNILVLGESGTGKTSIINLLQGKPFEKSYKRTTQSTLHSFLYNDIQLNILELDANIRLCRDIPCPKFDNINLVLYISDDRKISHKYSYWRKILADKLTLSHNVIFILNKCDITQKPKDPFSEHEHMNDCYTFLYFSCRTKVGESELKSYIQTVFATNLVTSSIIDESSENDIIIATEQSVDTTSGQAIISSSNVKLISYTKYCTDETSSEMNLADMVVYCARVSNPLNQELKKHDDNNIKLINYLITNKHWSPFEMVNICLEITTSRDISRQIIRHRSFSFQEFSQRYAETSSDPIFRECRMQDSSNRQNSLSIDEGSELSEEWLSLQSSVYKQAETAYKEALSKGIAKEQARALLPEGLTQTTLYVNGTLRSWIHYIEIRSGPETQKEHRFIATECAQVISSIFPMILDFVK